VKKTASVYVVFATPYFFLLLGVVLGFAFAFASLGFYTSRNQISFSDFMRHFIGKMGGTKIPPPPPS
jgi:hypothetical protein